MPGQTFDPCTRRWPSVNGSPSKEIVLQRVARPGDPTRVVFAGELGEHTDLRELLDASLTGPVVFHLAGMRRINSAGSHLWVLPRFACSRCKNAMSLDDEPERYLAFRDLMPPGAPRHA